MEFQACWNLLNPPRPKAMVMPEIGISGGPMAPGAIARAVSLETASPETGVLMSPITRLNPARMVFARAGLKIWVSSAVTNCRREKTWQAVWPRGTVWFCGPQEKKELRERF